MLLAFVIILLLVLANGLFVAAEFAIVGATRASIDHQAAQGNRLAQRVARVLEDPREQGRYIATTQVGITLASLGLGMYGEHVLAEWIAAWLAPYDDSPWIAAHALASGVALGILTYMHIVLGEMVPKGLALQSADTTVLYVSPVIEALGVAIKPLVVALSAAGTALLRAVGIRRQEADAERYHTPEELEYIVRESHEGGMLRGEAGTILRELFEFGDLTAAQAMVPRVRLVGIPVETEIDELRQLVRTHSHTRYPVYAGDLDHIVGSVHIKALLRHFIAGRPVTARDARPVPYIPATMAMDDVLAAMRRNSAQMAVVLDEYGGTAGLVTIEDLFEEVVGEIEEGRERAPIVRDGDGRFIVRGTVRLKDVGEKLGIPLEHPDVESVSGLVLTELGRPATAGDVVVWNSIRVEVRTAAGLGVGDAIVSRAAVQPNTAAK
ncbi:MAG TPA: hemolysin family protein [Vicinamibacterales bacterium]|nr:hemolysin family protein [Vicinamibacterales bacterium]